MINEGIFGSLMGRAPLIVEEWCEETGLTVNKDNTELILFTRKRKTEVMKMTKLFGTRLGLTDRVKWCSTGSRDWKGHAEERTRKALRIFWQWRSVFGKKWDLRPSVMLLLLFGVGPENGSAM